MVNWLTVVCILLTPTIHCYIDLFLNSNETTSILGHNGSFFYLFNGELRLHSIKHRLEIPFDRDYVELSWRTSIPKIQVDYRISEHGLMHSMPKNRFYSLSINSTGVVPNTLSKFRIQFNCRNVSVDDYIDLNLDVVFSINESLILSNPQIELISTPGINLTVKYRKFCSETILINRLLTRPTPKSSFTVAYVIIGILVGSVAVMALAYVYHTAANRRRRQLLSHHVEAAPKPVMSKYESFSSIKSNKTKIYNEEQRCERPLRPQEVRAPTNGFVKNASGRRVAPRPRPLRSDDNLTANNLSSNIYETVPDQSITANNEAPMKSLNVTANTIASNYNNASVVTAITTTGGWTRRLNPSQVDMCEKIGKDQLETVGEVVMEGTYSRINEARLHSDDNESVRVLVKMVNERASKDQTNRMLIESAMLRGLNHKNINSVIGVCLGEDVSMSFFPYCELGNMKFFLAKVRESNKRGRFESEFNQELISVQEILYMVLQLLKGVNFLHSKHIIHRDIATRNCWLDKNMQLKLSDYALSRDMFPNDYHCLADNEIKPVHWMSVESLRHGTFNTKTDIWSCGVFVWECFSLAAQPYADVDPFEFVDYLLESEANRLAAGHCPVEIFDVIERCWRSDPSERPPLKEIFNSTHRVYNSLKNYV